MNIEPLLNGIHVHAFDSAVPFRLLSADGKWEPLHEWHRGCFLAQERYRGLDDQEDHLNAAAFTTHLALGKSATLAFTTESSVDLNGESTLEAQRTPKFWRRGLEIVRKQKRGHQLGSCNSSVPPINSL